MILNKEKLASVGLTGFLLLLVILSSPIQALQMSILTDKSSYTRSETVTFTVSTEIEHGERIPIDNVTLNITGPGGSFSCILPYDYSYTNQAIICGSQTITASLDLNSNFGYGYLNADYDYLYNWGYGYGYGYDLGSVEIGYTIEWNIPSDWSLGEYTAEVIYGAGGDLLTDQTTFNVVDTTTTTTSGGGGGGSSATTTTLPETTTLPCEYNCQSTCADDLTPPLCYERISHGTQGCSGGTVCCESLEIECSISETTTTTIPEEGERRNPLTGLMTLPNSILDFFAKIWELIKIFFKNNWKLLMTILSLIPVSVILFWLINELRFKIIRSVPELYLNYPF